MCDSLNLNQEEIVVLNNASGLLQEVLEDFIKSDISEYNPLVAYVLYNKKLIQETINGLNKMEDDNERGVG